VQTVLKTHEGFLAIESKPGSGTSFRVYIPAIPVPNSAASDRALSPGLPHGNGELLLIVDDEPTMVDAMVTSLEGFGYQTLRATNGIEAIARYTENSSSIRLVITDEEMPRFNGRLLVRTLRRIAPELPTLLVTGAPGKRGAKEDRDATGFLGKPFTASTLLHKIQELLKATCK
jgi:CheY-like chemotaxis protein